MRVALVGMDSVYFVPRLCDLLGRTEGIDWVACCDLGVAAEEAEANSGKSPRVLAEEHEVPLFNDLETMLAEMQIDAAAVATHPRRIPAAAARLAQAGAHLYLVKPPAMDLAGVQMLRDSLVGRDQVAVSGLTYRLQPGVASAVEAVEEGRIGRLSSVRVMHQHGRLSAWPQGSWYHTDPELSPALYLGWYCVDVLRWLTGERVGEALAVSSAVADPASPQPDTFRAVAALPSGISASLDVYFGVSWPYPEFEIEILGDQGALRLNSEGGELRTAEGRFPLAVFQVDLFAHEIEHWVQACRGEEKSWHLPEEWLEVLEDTILLAEAAGKEG